MIALLKAKIGSSSFKRNSGTFFRSVSNPTQRKLFLVKISFTSCFLFIIYFCISVFGSSFLFSSLRICFIDIIRLAKSSGFTVRSSLFVSSFFFVYTRPIIMWSVENYYSIAKRFLRFALTTHFP